MGQGACHLNKCQHPGSNQGPSDLQAEALPTEQLCMCFTTGYNEDLSNCFYEGFNECFNEGFNEAFNEGFNE